MSRLPERGLITVEVPSIGPEELNMTLVIGTERPREVMRIGGWED